MIKYKYDVKRSNIMKIFKSCLSVLVVLCMLLSFVACAEERSVSGVGDGGDGFVGKKKKKDNVVVEGDLEIHCLELGNKYTGDCTYIKAGEMDILIDAGSKVSSIETIDKYISQYVEDEALEYVIVTHAHEDHYAGFATDEKRDSLFDLFECKTIIDFAQITESKAEQKMYKNYIRERDAEIEKGAVHYTAAECVKMGGVFDLGEGIKLTVLDSYYYYNRAKSENDHSVCVMLDDGKNSYLFTGDLEKEGEEKLIEMNELPEVKLYKAGHHGSKTSSCEAFMAVIKPEIVCVCCCCGSPEYTDKIENQFPSQVFINRVAPYTDAVYVTTLCIDYKEAKFESMNGNIIVRSNAGEVEVVCSESKDKLKDTKWFKENRTVPKAWQTKK